MILVCVVGSSGKLLKEKNTKIIANESSVEWKKSVQGDEQMTWWKYDQTRVLNPCASKCRVNEIWTEQKKENLWIKEWVAFIRKEKNNLNLFETDKTDFPGLLLHILIILITSYNASAAYEQKYVEVVFYLCVCAVHATNNMNRLTGLCMYKKRDLECFIQVKSTYLNPFYAVINSVYYSDQL